MQQNLDIHLKRYKHPRLFKIFKAKEMQTINNSIFINNKLILATLSSENKEQLKTESFQPNEMTNDDQQQNIQNVNPQFIELLKYQNQGVKRKVMIQDQIKYKVNESLLDEDDEPESFQINKINRLTNHNFNSKSQIKQNFNAKNYSKKLNLKLDLFSIKPLLKKKNEHINQNMYQFNSKYYKIWDQPEIQKKNNFNIQNSLIIPIQNNDIKIKKIKDFQAKTIIEDETDQKIQNNEQKGGNKIKTEESEVENNKGFELNDKKIKKVDFGICMRRILSKPSMSNDRTIIQNSQTPLSNQLNLSMRFTNQGYFSSRNFAREKDIIQNSKVINSKGSKNLIDVKTPSKSCLSSSSQFQIKARTNNILYQEFQQKKELTIQNIMPIALAPPVNIKPVLFSLQDLQQQQYAKIKDENGNIQIKQFYNHDSRKSDKKNSFTNKGAFLKMRKYSISNQIKQKNIKIIKDADLRIQAKNVNEIQEKVQLGKRDKEIVNKQFYEIIPRPYSIKQEKFNQEIHYNQTQANSIHTESPDQEAYNQTPKSRGTQIKRNEESQLHLNSMVTIDIYKKHLENYFVKNQNSLT